MVQGKHLAEPGPENPVAGRADVGHPASIEPGHPQPQGDDHRHSQKEGPEDSGFPPKDGGGNLDDVHDDSHGNENPTKIGELFFAFHLTGYIPNGFGGKLPGLGDSPAESLQHIQPGLLLVQSLPCRKNLLLQQKGKGAAGILLLQKLEDAVDGQPRLPKKADHPQPLQILLRVEPPPTLRQCAGHQNASGIIVLHRPDGNAAELGNLSRCIDGHSVRLLTPSW